MDSMLEAMGISVPGARDVASVVVRLIGALIAGAVIGLQREHSGKAAGLRTHMLVCMGTALFVIAGTQDAMAQDAMSRVIQGLATGIGFLGAGAIIKMENTREIRGLTTASGIWMTAAIGVAVGLGHLVTAAIAVLLAWIVLALIIKLEARIAGSDERA